MSTTAGGPVARVSFSRRLSLRAVWLGAAACALLVVTGAFWLRGPTVSAARPPLSGHVLIGAGDICVGYDIEKAEATAALIEARPRDAVFTLGDNSNEAGTAEQYADCYGATWGPFLYRTHATAGNHDYITAGGNPYFSYFGAAAGPRRTGYYSYDMTDDWHVVVLNSQCSEVGGCGPGSPQETFLRDDLDANPAKHIIAMWHIPTFSSGAVGNNPSFTAWWNDLYRAHADIILNGHDHDYERFGLQSPAAVADAGGIREFVVGTGGAKPGGFARDKVRANSELRSRVKYGVLELTLNSHSYDWRFLPVGGGAAVDSGTQPTHS
jgi:acid phosphatase type 7